MLWRVHRASQLPAASHFFHEITNLACGLNGEAEYIELRDDYADQNIDGYSSDRSWAERM